MENLKFCPFCGSEAEIRDKTEERILFKRTFASGREYVREITLGRNNRIAHIYRVSCFEVGCTNKKCIGYRNTRIYKTKSQAAYAWNGRKSK